MARVKTYHKSKFAQLISNFHSFHKYLIDDETSFESTNLNQILPIETKNDSEKTKESVVQLHIDSESQQSQSEKNFWLCHDIKTTVKAKKCPTPFAFLKWIIYGIAWVLGLVLVLALVLLIFGLLLALVVGLIGWGFDLHPTVGAITILFFTMMAMTSILVFLDQLGSRLNSPTKCFYFHLQPQPFSYLWMNLSLKVLLCS